MELTARNLAQLIVREFMENNVIEKNGYLSWREKRVNAIVAILEQAFLAKTCNEYSGEE